VKSVTNAENILFAPLRKAWLSLRRF